MTEKIWQRGMHHCWLQILHAEKAAIEGKGAEISLRLLNIADQLYASKGFQQFRERTEGVATGTSKEDRAAAIGNAFHAQFFDAVQTELDEGKLPKDLILSPNRGPDVRWYGDLIIAWDLTSRERFAFHYNRDVLGIPDEPRPVPKHQIHQETANYWDFFVAIGY